MVNPRVSAGIGRRGAEPMRIVLDAPVRGRGRLHNLVDRPVDPIFDVLLTMFGGAGGAPPLDLAPQQVARLHDLGVLVTPEEISRDVVLLCPLVAHEGDRLPAADERWMIRGDLAIQEDDTPPAAFADYPMQGLSSRRPVVWHRASKDHPVAVWWPDADCLSVLRSLLAGETVSGAARACLPALARQGIVARADAPRDTPPYEMTPDRFRTEAMTELNPSLPTEFIENLAAYYHALAGEGLLQRRDAQSDRYYAHNDPVACFVQHSFRPLVARLAERAVKCSYSYLSWYCGGAELGLHTDRPQCAYSVTLLLDYLPAPVGKSPWPLRIVPRGGGAPVEFRQARGGALLYRGTELSHSRAALPPDHTSMSVLLHYVDPDFTGPLN